LCFQNWVVSELFKINFICRYQSILSIFNYSTFLYKTTNRELDNLTDWFQENKLSLNASETNYIIYDIHLKKLVIMQKKTIRVIAGIIYYPHTEPIFKHLRVLKLADIYTIQVSKYILNFPPKLLPFPLNNLFTASRTVHKYTTHHCTAMKLQTLSTWTVVISQCITNKGAQIRVGFLLEKNIFYLTL